MNEEPDRITVRDTYSAIRIAMDAADSQPLDGIVVNSPSFSLLGQNITELEFLGKH